MKLLFLGDSLTAYHDWSHFGAHHNAGIPGDTTDGLLYRLHHTLDKQPEHLVLMIGINDLLQSIPLEQIKTNYSLIIEALVPTSDLYILSCLPVTGFDDAVIVNQDVMALNRYLINLADAHHCTHIDLHEPFCDQSGALKERLTTDGVHLSDEGYALWERVIDPYLSGIGTHRP
jgi:lysophospholipase L1-like esterase